jgi:signal transduction histidine kinase
MCLENITYGFLLFLTGGFSSPFLWYFLSSLTIVMATGIDAKRARITASLLVVWGFACALAGGVFGFAPEGAKRLGTVNTAIAFFVVAAGFSLLFIYMGRLDQKQRELNQSNDRLKAETLRSEQALRQTLDIYEAFNLFSATAPGKVMDEIMSMLCQTIAPGGCLLFKMSILGEMEPIGCRGFSEQERAVLVERISAINLITRAGKLPERMTEAGKQYAIAMIQSTDLSQVQGVLITPDIEVDAENEHSCAQRMFYLNLIRLILQQLDLQAVVESYIVSEEQNRIASEIHDTVIQKLFAVACNLSLLSEEQGSILPEENRQRIRQITKIVESSMRELRETIYGLRWDPEEQDSFSDKLTAYMDEVKYLSGADVSLILDDAIQHMSMNQRTFFYRIICETVNNAIRHGRATNIEIRMWPENDRIIAEVNDNGVGFDQRLIPAGGRGLKNMVKMAHLLKGNLSIVSRIGNGTTIRCVLPC